MINIFGRGGHAKMIASLSDQPVTFFDEADYSEANNFDWIIGIGRIDKRIEIAKLLNNCKFQSINKGTYVADDLIFGEGTLIAPGVIIQNNVKIGKHSIINTSASIDHDCYIGDFCHIAPNCTLCGTVKIGSGTLLGAGSVVLPGIIIGENCIIGAGSVVTKNIPSNKTVYGNPAKIISK
jgi:sugar O-acyltransferase (sialic acid O-acetyltransferase NeuD family)